MTIVHNPRVPFVAEQAKHKVGSWDVHIQLDDYQMGRLQYLFDRAAKDNTDGRPGIIICQPNEATGMLMCKYLEHDQGIMIINALIQGAKK